MQNQDGSYCLHDPNFPGIKTFPPRDRPTPPSPPLISRLLSFLSTDTSASDEVLRTYSTLSPLVLPIWKLYNDLATKHILGLLHSPSFSLEFTLFFSRIVDPLKLLAVAHRDLEKEFGVDGMGSKSLRPEMRGTGAAKITAWCTAGKPSEWVKKLELLETVERLGETLGGLKMDTEALSEGQVELVEKQTEVLKREAKVVRMRETQRIEREQQERRELEKQHEGVLARLREIEEEQERLRQEGERLQAQRADLKRRLAPPSPSAPPSTLAPVLAIPFLSSTRDDDEAPPTESLGASSPSAMSSRSASSLPPQTETTSRPSTAEAVDETDRLASGDEQHVLLLCKSVLLGLLEKQEEQASSLRDLGHPVALTPIPPSYRLPPHRSLTSSLAAARGLPPLQFGTPPHSEPIPSLLDPFSAPPPPPSSRPTSPSFPASSTAEFIQGSSKDHPTLPAQPHPFLTLAPKLQSAKAKGKGPQEPCTCHSVSALALFVYYLLTFIFPAFLLPPSELSPTSGVLSATSDCRPPHLSLLHFFQFRRLHSHHSAPQTPLDLPARDARPRPRAQRRFLARLPCPSDSSPDSDPHDAKRKARRGSRAVLRERLFYGA